MTTKLPAVSVGAFLIFVLTAGSAAQVPSVGTTGDAAGLRRNRGAGAHDQAEQGVQLTALTIEEALARSVRNTVSRDISGIAFAKSRGVSAKQFGKYVGELTAFFWDPIKGSGPTAFVQYMYRFLQTDRQLTMEITSATPAAVNGRHKVYGASVVRAFAPLHVGLDEYVDYYGAMFQALAEHLGLDYTQHLRGEWVVFEASRTTR